MVPARPSRPDMGPSIPVHRRSPDIARPQDVIFVRVLTLATLSIIPAARTGHRGGWTGISWLGVLWMAFTLGMSASRSSTAGRPWLAF